MKGGFALARRYGSKVRLDERKLKVGRYVLDRQGGKVVFFGRLFRFCAPIFPSSPAPCIWSEEVHCGQRCRRRHMGCRLYGSFIYAANTLKKSVGDDRYRRRRRGHSRGRALVVVVRKQVNALADKAEAAYPGPLE